MMLRVKRDVMMSFEVIFLIYSPLKANYYKFRVIYYKILQLQ